MKKYINSLAGRITLVVLVIIVLYVAVAKYMRAQAIQTIIQKIRDSETWLAQEQQKADTRGITLEQMLLIDAEWILKNSEKWQNKWWNW